MSKCSVSEKSGTEGLLLFTLHALYARPNCLSRFTTFVRILLNTLGRTVAQQPVLLCLSSRRSWILTAHIRVPSEISRMRSSEGYGQVIVVATPLSFSIQYVD
jgi:hypothetical protein